MWSGCFFRACLCLYHVYILFYRFTKFVFFHRVVEFAATIPSRLRLKGNQTKYVLKKAMVDILPREILNRGKEGFSIPIKNWLKNELKPMMLDTLSENRLRQDGFFEPKYVARLIDDHLNGVENHSHRLWALMMFTQWHDIYMKS